MRKRDERCDENSHVVSRVRVSVPYNDTTNDLYNSVAVSITESDDGFSTDHGRHQDSNGDSSIENVALSEERELHWELNRASTSRLQCWVTLPGCSGYIYEPLQDEYGK